MHKFLRNMTKIFVLHEPQSGNFCNNNTATASSALKTQLKRNQFRTANLFDLVLGVSFAASRTGLKASLRDWFKQLVVLKVSSLQVGTYHSSARAAWRGGHRRRQATNLTVQFGCPRILQTLCRHVARVPCSVSHFRFRQQSSAATAAATEGVIALLTSFSPLDWWPKYSHGPQFAARLKRVTPNTPKLQLCNIDWIQAGGCRCWW